MQENSVAPLLTSEVAQILGVSEATVRGWERLGRLHAVRTSKGVRLFDRRDVEQLARDREQHRASGHVPAEALA